ncbi:hypothetical protein JCM19379_29020 [Methyloparacoccus murrellii]
MGIITSLPEVRSVLDLAAQNGLANFATREDWLGGLGCFAKTATENDTPWDEAEAAAREFSESYPDYDPEVFNAQWSSVKERAISGRRMIGVGTFIKRLKDAGIDWKRAVIADPFAKAEEMLSKAEEQREPGQADEFDYFRRKGLTGIECITLVGSQAWAAYHDHTGAELLAIQTFGADGSKRFKAGSKLDGACWDPLGWYVGAETRRVVLVEGVGDALAIVQAYREAGNPEIEEGRTVVLAAGSAVNLAKLVGVLAPLGIPNPDPDSPFIRVPLRITLALDNDKAGRAAASKIAAAIPKWISYALPPGECKDFDDARREVGAAAVVAALQAADWKPEPAALEGELIQAERVVTKPGRGRPRNANQGEIIAGIRGLEAARECLVYFDSFEDQVFVCWGEDEARPLGDRDLTRAVVELENCGLQGVSRDFVRHGVEFVAFENQRDSLREAVLGLPSPSRFIDPLGLLVRYMGAADTPLNRAVGRYILLKALDRALNAGCMSEIVPILLGAQGCGKSTFIRLLPWVPEWAGRLDYHDESAERIRQLRGKWIAEWAETTGLSKRDREYIKADISRQEDSHTPKYCEMARIRKRQYFVIGSSNERELFSDPTGSRRFAVVEVGRFDQEAFLRDRADIWGSALQVYRQEEGRCNYAEVERLAAEVAGEYEAVDPWQASILDYVRDYPAKGEITIDGVAKAALKIEVDRLDQRTSKRVAEVLRGLGFGRRRIRAAGGGRCYIFVPDGDKFTARVRL